MVWDDVSRANCIALLCAARSATGQPTDGILNSDIRIAVGAVLARRPDETEAVSAKHQAWPHLAVHVDLDSTLEMGRLKWVPRLAARLGALSERSVP